MHPIVPDLWRVVELDTQQLSKWVNIVFGPVLKVVFIKFRTRGYTFLKAHSFDGRFFNVYTFALTGP